jgi:hypothetical protein
MPTSVFGFAEKLRRLQRKNCTTACSAAIDAGNSASLAGSQGQLPGLLEKIL